MIGCGVEYQIPPATAVLELDFEVVADAEVVPPTWPPATPYAVGIAVGENVSWKAGRL